MLGCSPTTGGGGATPTKIDHAQEVNSPPCSGARGFANFVRMPRQSRTASRDAEPSYPVWKAAAVKALHRLHAPAAMVTRDGLWTRFYVRGFSPKQAAELAEREYYSTQPPSWLKM